MRGGTTRLRARSGMVLAAAAALVAGLSGCTTPTRTAAGGPGSGLAPVAGGEATFRASDPLERVIAPFPVRDRQGERYDFPFLGGFDVPRPHLVDINGNGKLDLFIQKYRDELTFFENVGTAEAPRFEWRSSRYQDLPVGEWVRFFDLDGNGSVDLFMELPSSYIQVAKNVGTPSDPRFEITGDTIRTPEGRPIFADAQNIPFLVDIDCNGLPDLFLGRLDGSVSRYELASSDGGVPTFGLVAERFENIQIVGAFTPIPDPIRPPEGEASSRPTLHGANSMAFADWTGNGAPDLFWGDFFEPGLLLLRNEGTCSYPILDVEPTLVPADPVLATSGYNAPALGDLTGNGQPDLLVGVLGGAYNANRTAADNLHFYRGSPDGTLTLESTRFLNGLDVGSEAVPAFADLTGNGLLDLVIGSKLDPSTSAPPPLFWYRNTGTPEAPSFEWGGSVPEVAHLNGAPILADLTGNGLPDLLVGSFNEGVLLYRNEGTAAEPRFVPDPRNPVARPARGSYFAPAVGDLDGDGLLDLVVGEASGELNHFRNVGTATEPRFELVTEELGGIEVGARSSPFLADLTGNGVLDLLVGERSGQLLVYRNEGTRQAPAFQSEPVALEGHFPRLAAPRLVDLHNAGTLDLVVGDQDGGLVYFRNLRDAGSGG